MQPDMEKTLKEAKGLVDKFQKQVLKAQDKILAITLLPPKEDRKEDINIVVLMDDREIKFQEKLKFRDEAFKVVNDIAVKMDKKLLPDVLLLEELWQNCYDGKYDLLQLLSQSATTYDTGMLAAVRLTEVHKSMVIKKFEKYVVSYVLAGSLVQGRATPESDIDVFCVVDDTDVKKMTRFELREKLRSIIIGMGTEAGMITGTKNKLNVQVYILTDFWDGIKEANPVYFTFLRDGVPFYDRGMFMPWKLLLKMGRIRPSPESIDMHMSSGDQMLKRVQFKINEIGIEDMFWATLNPSQAALMMYGLPPPTPKETPELMRDIFVKKEKLLEEEYVKILEEIIKTRKMLEHDPTKNITGKEVDKLLSGAEKYLKRVKRLFEQLQKEKEKDLVLQIHEEAAQALRDALILEGVEKVKDDELVAKCNTHLVSVGRISQRALTVLKTIVKAKEDYEKKKLTKAEADKVKKEKGVFIRAVLDYVQGKRGREIEKARIRVKHGEKLAEITLLEDKAYIVDDVDAENKEVFVAPIKKDGSIGTAKPSSLEDFEGALVKAKIPEKVFIKQTIFSDIKKRYGEGSEVLITF